jgi:hypothetical protein
LALSSLAGACTHHPLRTSSRYPLLRVMYLTSQLHKVFVATRHDQFSRGNKRRAPEISIHVSAAYSIVAAITARFAHGFRYPFQTSST